MSSWKKLGLTFEKITMVPNRKVFKKNNICVISILMFYENRKIMIYKVLGSVIYCIIDNYLCVGFMCLQKVRLSLEHKYLKRQHSMIFQELAFHHYEWTSWCVIGLRKIINQLLSCNIVANWFPVT